jgi:zinc protease
MYGDHPIGWEMSENDLAPERVSPERFRRVHRDVICRDNLVLGVTGDASWPDVAGLIDDFVARVPSCPADLPEAPLPEVRREPGIFVIDKDVEQAVIVLAHATDVRLADDPAYFSAILGNSILGGGGFSSRITRRVRTEEGYAYSATSLWTTPRRYAGLLGAVTGTSPENTVPAIRVILGTMEELRRSPPTDGEVRTTIDRIVNGFVFNFDTPGQIVSRMMYYLAQDLPDDWLHRYWRGVQAVTPSSIQQAFAQHLHPEEMTILVVGDPDRIGRSALDELGSVRVLDIR